MRCIIRRITQLFLLFFVIAWTTMAFAAKPVIFYSDLINGPKTGGKNNKGAFVTIWGANFGASRGSSYVTVGSGQTDNYPVWTDRKITFQLGPNAKTGEIVVHTPDGSSNGIPFTINEGHIYFADINSVNNPGSGTYEDPWRSPKSFYSQLSPGDILYIRAGIYTEQYGNAFMGGNYQVMLGVSGTSNAYIATITYPGESVTFKWGKGRHFRFRNASNNAEASYYVVSQLIMDGMGTAAAGGVDTAGYYLNEEEGGHYIRIVGCRITNCAKGSSTTMTGHVRFTNDNCKLLGTEIDNCGVKGNPFNNNHLVYIQCGADDIEIAYCKFHDNAAGHCIQIHADHAPYVYNNIRIHNNYITADNPGDMRGPTVSNVLNDTEVYFYNNIVSKLGWFSGFNVVHGKAYIYNNTFYTIGGNSVVSLMSNNGQFVYLRNNIMWSDGNVPYVFFGSYGGKKPSWDNVLLENNCYYNNGSGPSQDSHPINANPQLINPSAGDFRLQADSPCRDQGTSAVSSVVIRDFNGILRSSYLLYDIGAYEYQEGQQQSGDSTPPTAPQNFSEE